jgi:hypothetical protein
MRRPKRSALAIIIAVLGLGILLVVGFGDRKHSTAAQGVGGAGWTCVYPGKGQPVCVK